MQLRHIPSASLFPVLIAGLLAGLTYWLEITSQPQETPTANGKLRHDPDYMIENFEVRRHDKQGRLQHTLRAASMHHYPDDDSTMVNAPYLTIHRDPPTHVTAKEGRLDSQGEHIQLSGDVRVMRAAQRGKAATLLTTERLEAIPDDGFVRTLAPVVITQGSSRIAGAGGLQGNRNTAVYVLEGPVRGIFHRNAGAMALPAAVALPPPLPAARAAVKPQTAPKPAAKPKPKAEPKTKPKAKSTTKAKP